MHIVLKTVVKSILFSYFLLCKMIKRVPIKWLIVVEGNFEILYKVLKYTIVR